jgi:hypothetical protein
MERSTASRTTFWPLIVALAVFFGGLGVIVAQAFAGHSVAYPTDDTYIHMAIAKNLANNGTWGVNAGEFAAASSSPLWTILLAIGFKVAGVRRWIPFGFALVCAILLLIAVDYMGRREGWLPWFRGCVLCMIIVIMPLIPMTVLGMEHVLHTLLTCVVIYLVWCLPLQPGRISARFSSLLLLTIFLTTAARFEGLFLAMAVALILLLQRRWLLALSVVTVSILPVAIMGAACASHGWGWLPSSIRLKGNIQSHAGLIGSIKGMLGETLEHFRNIFPHIAAALVAPMVALAVIPARFIDSRAARVTVVFVLVVIQHLSFARTGWFFRYEAYLMAAEILILGLITAKAMSSLTFAAKPVIRSIQGWGIVVLGATLAVPQLGRGVYSMAVSSIAMKNIHDQQVQMAAFVSRYYPGSVVAANDIGALCLNGNAEILDLWGLGDLRLFKAKLDGQYTSKTIGDYCASRKVEIAVAYRTWLEGDGGLPANWKRVGTLQIEHNHFCGSDTVTFYAVAPGSAEKLAQAMKDFAVTEPADVHIRVDSSDNGMARR